jgi:hypothetical protein
VPAGSGSFVALDVAALLGVTEAIAWTLVHETTNLRARHPRLWEAAKAGLVEGWAGPSGRPGLR